MNSPTLALSTRPARPTLSRGARILAWLTGLLLLLLLLLLTGPLAQFVLHNDPQRGSWYSANRASSGQAPLPTDEKAAVIQVYAARVLGWRGAFAVHTWVSTKRANASAYQVHQVIGWRHYRGGSPVVSESGTPDFHWFGARPQQLVDLRGEQAGALIDRIEQAVHNYPYADRYTAWPGPNSNTFTAYIARQVPGLKLDLPPTAIGKDFLGNYSLIAAMPSGTGLQISLAGIFGLGVSPVEGIEFNLLGLSAGLDFNEPALRLPGLGRIPAQ